MYGDIGVYPTSERNVFHLTCMIDGLSSIATKDRAGVWIIANGQGISTLKMIEGAAHVGELIDQYLLENDI